MRTHKHFKQNRPKKSLLLAGEEAILEAIYDGTEIERIYVQHGLTSAELKKLSEEKGIPVNKVPVEKLRGFNMDGSPGVIALKSKIHYKDLQDVVSFVIEKGEAPLFLLLDGITDIRNIGAIARSAWCFGVQALIIPQKGVGTLNDDAIATSAGALEFINVCRVKDLHEAIDVLHLNGIRVLASEMKAKKQVFELDLALPVAIVLGSEDKGIHASLYKKCDEVFSVPMMNQFESLNVSAAGAVILYEAMTQRIKNAGL